jgi:hypothetical protein
MFGRASAQQLAPPTDTDLNAAYCLRITQRQIAAIPVMGRTEAVNKAIGEARDRVNRLQSYLTPRSGSVDGAALLAATKRADADSDQLATLTDRCINALCRPDDTPDSCTMKLWSCVGSDLQARVHACDELIWLPY